MLYNQNEIMNELMKDFNINSSRQTATYNNSGKLKEKTFTEYVENSQSELNSREEDRRYHNYNNNFKNR